jgi:hypothetical protein
MSGGNESSNASEAAEVVEALLTAAIVVANLRAETRQRMGIG